MTRILLSAYACEPDRGSEPGVGWEWATRLSVKNKVYVLTRANNREKIEGYFARAGSNENMIMIYHDLPPLFLSLKKKGLLPVFIYYLLWQLTARFKGARYFKEVEVIHHVTFNGFRFPGAWWSVPKPVILGPLGGASVAHPAYKRCFGSHWFAESIRALSVKLWRLNPWTLLSLNEATKVMAVGDEMVKKLADADFPSESMLETALPLLLEQELSQVPAAGRKDFVIVGNLEPWKGWQIAFHAYASADCSQASSPRLIVIGTGRQLAEAKALAEKLHISGKVDFLGQQSRDKTWEVMSKARGLLFSSVRDTSGNVVLEAMGQGVPVVCFNHQGVGFMTTDECAYRVTPGDWDSSVSGFSSAISSLASDDSMVDRMGAAGRRRAISHLTWNAKVSRMEEIYEAVQANKSQTDS